MQRKSRRMIMFFNDMEIGVPVIMTEEFFGRLQGIMYNHYSAGLLSQKMISNKPGYLSVTKIKGV